MYPKVVITNVVLSNSGDAAILEGIITALVSHGVTTRANVVVIDSNSVVTRRLYPALDVEQLLTLAVPRHPRRWGYFLTQLKRRIVDALSSGNRVVGWSLMGPMGWTAMGRTLRHLASADVVIGTGGTYLIDKYHFGFRAAELQVARNLGKRVYLWTQSMGPFADEESCRAIRQIIEATEVAYFRDAKSQDYWRKMGGTSHEDAVVPDAAFALNVVRRSVRPSLRALISVRDWPHPGPTGMPVGSGYRESLRAAVAKLRSLNFDVVALSTCQGVRDYVDDSEIAESFFADLPVHVDHDFHSPYALVQEIERSRIVITTRMHLAILSLISGVPVIAIAYEFKTVELFAALGLADFAIAIENVTPGAISELIRRLIETPALATITPEHLERLRMGSMRPALDLLNSLSNE